MAQTRTHHRQTSWIVDWIGRLSENVWWHANISDILFDQKSPAHREMGFPRWYGHTHTHKRHRDTLTRPRWPSQWKYLFLWMGKLRNRTIMCVASDTTLTRPWKSQQCKMHSSGPWPCKLLLSALLLAMNSVCKSWPWAASAPPLCLTDYIVLSTTVQKRRNSTMEDFILNA